MFHLSNYRQGSDARLLEGLRNRMDRVFEDFFEDFGGLFGEAPLTRQLPAVNLWEDEKNLYAECELPGVRGEDLEVTTAGNELHIRGEWSREAAGDGEYHREERLTGSFSRVMRLPGEIDSESVNADLQNGVLTVTMPKAKAAQARKIEVKRVEK